MNKADIEALQLDDKIKTDLLSLFEKIETKETELIAIRAKVPTSSQKVVESIDHDKFIAATKELETLKQSMASKLGDKGGEEGDEFLTAFASFFD